MAPVDGEVRYAKHGAAHVAYRVWGEGPTLVWLPSQFIPIIAMHEEPAYERFLSRLASFSTVIAFDRPGIGLSDPIPADDPPSIDGWAAQIVSVLDAAGAEHAHVVAHLGGGLAAVALAAAHPERVSGLIMAMALGTFAIESSEEELINFVISSARPDFRDGGNEFNFLDEMAPTRASDPGFRSWWDGAGQRGASPSVAQTYLGLHVRGNVLDLLDRVTAPTLVIHRPAFKPVFTRSDYRFATAIAGAQLVEVPGVDALPWLPDSDAVVAEIENFVTGTRRAVEASRALRTIMFTDVVGSTTTAARMGDATWRDVLETHDQVMRGELARHGGPEIDTAGDGFLSTFEGPTRAVQCAARLHRAMDAVGLQLRIGIHCGEVEVRARNIAGIAVHIAARVQSLAEPGETLVTSTIKETMTGSSFAFSSRGAHSLKGVPDDWHLYSVT
jgi:class 3 adenylate cyclase